ncbi:uncharacterized protein Asalp_04130 [Aeromonas salmonicida subsp. pectinolytica 34mel]|uniref:Uncharacterized protein n=1 Tax=Aeromonas salmonicida subsp. pectinolytica 34mel TaxID=1324960 RepID=A0A2D1QBN3_AERSA|nr:uncharacterized protein Asalp_04130 [Aeromonas salmonicida subsp. pectinolytica 34mel]
MQGYDLVLGERLHQVPVKEMFWHDLCVLCDKTQGLKTA